MHARDTLLTATGFLMTSRFEGYPLASLESMSRGCPVISYDIKYGPREQITDGVDGFLTPAEDLQTFADRLVTMIRDPALVEKMSAAALEKAQLHDYRAFLRDWRTALETAVANKPNRVQLDRVDLRRPQAGPRPRWTAAAPAGPASGQTRGPPHAARGRVRRHPALARQGTTRDLRLGRGHPGRGLRRDGRGHQHPGDRATRRAQFDVRCRFDLEQVFAELDPGDRDVRLRLRVVWNNASWETTLARPTKQRAPIELNYTATTPCSSPGAPSRRFNDPLCRSTTQASPPTSMPPGAT